MSGRPRIADPKVSLTLSVPKSLVSRLQRLAECTPGYVGRTPNDIARGLLLAAVNQAEQQHRQDPPCRPRRERKPHAANAEEVHNAREPPTPPPELDTSIFRTQEDALAFLVGRSPLNSAAPPDDDKRRQEAASLASWQPFLPPDGTPGPPDPED